MAALTFDFIGEDANGGNDDGNGDENGSDG